MRAGAAVLLLLAAAAPPPGAASCSGCHAVRTSTPVPRLAGRPAAETVAALDAFRSGARSGTVMPRIAPGFTAAESQAIAEWWSAQAPAP